MTKAVDLAAAMKAGMRHLASGVAVLATWDENDERRGMTVTSITSISDQPPSLLVSLHLDSQSYRGVKHSGCFSLSVLRSEQQDISQRCAFTPDDECRFSLGNWGEHPASKIPYLRDALATFFCTSKKQMIYGTHAIIVADIDDVIVSDIQTDPLVYCRGAYYQLNELSRKS